MHCGKCYVLKNTPVIRFFQEQNIYIVIFSPFWVTLPTPPSEPKQDSVPWSCDGDLWSSKCSEGQTCVPAVANFFGDIDLVDKDNYRHTCYNSYTSKRENVVIQLKNSFALFFFDTLLIRDHFS